MNIRQMLSMGNKSVIKGNNNINVSGVKRSKVSIGETTHSKSKGKFWVIAGVVVTVIAVMLQIIIGWDQIIKWLYAK